jgi:hypothetical protein
VLQDYREMDSVKTIIQSLMSPVRDLTQPQEKFIVIPINFRIFKSEIKQIKSESSLLNEDSLFYFQVGSLQALTS